MDLSQTPESEQSERAETDDATQGDTPATEPETTTATLESMRDALTHELVETFKVKERENIATIDG